MASVFQACFLRSIFTFPMEMLRPLPESTTNKFLTFLQGLTVVLIKTRNDLKPPEATLKLAATNWNHSKTQLKLLESSYNKDFFQKLKYSTVAIFLTLREKCPYSEFFWSIFSAFGLNDTPYLSVFSPNAGKYGTEEPPIRTLITQCNAPRLIFFSGKFSRKIWNILRIESILVKGYIKKLGFREFCPSFLLRNKI